MKSKLSVMAFDTETTGLSPYFGHRIFSFSVGYESGKTRVFYGMNYQNDLWLRRFWADNKIAKVGHNIKFDLSMVRAGHNVMVPEDTVLHDTMIMARVVRNNLPHYSLDYLAKYYGGYDCPVDNEVEFLARQNGGYENVDRVVMEKYQRADAERTMLLFQTFWPEIQKDKKLLADYQNEMRLIEVTQRLEMIGVVFNQTGANVLEKDLTAKVESVKKRIAVYSPTLNIDSPKQVASLLYDKLKLPVPAYTEKGERSTNKAYLPELHHPCADAILEAKAYSTGLKYIRNYRENIAPDKRIHPTINTNEATTGRESCNSPNLQNVRKETNIKERFSIPLRRCFCAPPGYVLLFGDYSGIEMRLIVESTGEPELLKMLEQDRNADLHMPTVECFLGAVEAWGMKKENPKEFSIQRGAHKNVGFCIAYGGGTEKVALTLGRPVHEVVDGDKRYRARFRRIATFSSSMARQVKRYGYIVTPFGRKIYVPTETAYIASNYMIQGTAAGILKRAQVKVDECIRREFKRVIQMVLPIHDELVFYLRRECIKDVKEICPALRDRMVDIPEITVPLEIEWKWSNTTWDKAVKL